VRISIKYKLDFAIYNYGQWCFLVQKILLVIDPFFGVNFGGIGGLSWYGQLIHDPQHVGAGLETLHQQYSKLIEKYSKEKENIFILVFGKGKHDSHEYYLSQTLPKRVSEIRGNWQSIPPQANALLAQEATKRFGENRVVMIGHNELGNLPKILREMGLKVEPTTFVQVCGGLYSTKKGKTGCVDTFSKEVASGLGLKTKPNVLKNATIVAERGQVVFPWQRSQRGRNNFLGNLFEIKGAQGQKVFAPTGRRTTPLIAQKPRRRR